MSSVRWNFRLGPIRITSPFGALSWGLVGAVVLMCCCGGLIGTTTDGGDNPARPVVNASTLPPTRSAQPTPAKSAVASPTPNRTTSAPKPATKPPTRKPAPKNDPRFDTCAEAGANGYGPYVEGEDPEYDWYRDRDGDGRVCEPA